MPNTQFITDRQIYEQVIQGAVPTAKRFLWLATSDLKDLYVAKGKRMVPFLEVLSGLVDAGVAIRLLHAKEPGPAFREDFDRYPNLIDGMERILCPRVHFKSVIVDGTYAYSGSANLTGAGVGAKSSNRRNFESGFVTTAPGPYRRSWSSLTRYGWAPTARPASASGTVPRIPRCWPGVSPRLARDPVRDEPLGRLSVLAPDETAHGFAVPVVRVAALRGDFTLTRVAGQDGSLALASSFSAFMLTSRSAGSTIPVERAERSGTGRQQ